MTDHNVGSPLEGYRILIVEDDFLLASYLKKLLEENGCHIVGPAATVDRARAILMKDAVDAAILDLNLDGENTCDVARTLGDKNVPFVVVTGDRRSDIRSDILRQAVHLEKPVKADKLVRVLAALCGPAPSAAKLSP